MRITLPLQIAEIEKGNYHLFVEFRVGKKKARLLLDTGASKTVFDEERILRFVAAENVQPYESQSVGLGSDEVDTKVAALQKVKCGQLKIRTIEVAVLNLKHINQTYERLGLAIIDGVLGSDLLLKYEATISYKKKTLRLG
jgi:predicted aspartyl protease